MSDNYLVLKIAGGVVLGLLVWNVFDRYQQRRDMEEGLRQLQLATTELEGNGRRATANASPSQNAPNRSVSNSPKPVPPGFRCAGGTLLKRIDGGWMQVTDRHNEWYCPHGGPVDDCYRVSAQSTGCR